MIPVNIDSSRLFRLPPEKQSDEMLNSFVEDETEDNVSDQEEYIFCRQCRNRITSPAERIEVQGSHRHGGVTEALLQAAGSGGHHACPRGHGFQGRKTESFVPGEVEKQFGIPVESPQVDIRHIVQPPHRVSCGDPR